MDLNERAINLFERDANMPISSPSSFIATANEFITHWESVNADLGPGNEITVTQGRGVEDLQESRAQLVSMRDALEGALNGVSIASAAIRDHKRGLRTRFGQLSRQLRARYGDSALVAATPKAPMLNDSESRFTAPLLDAANVWQHLENEGGSLILPGAYGRADFEEGIAALGAEYLVWQTARGDVRGLRADRNALQRQIYQILKEYRQAVAGSLEPSSVFITTLPALTLPKRRKAADA